eukprot:755125-Hanusia_phi.AAC.2
MARVQLSEEQREPGYGTKEHMHAIEQEKCTLELPTNAAAPEHAARYLTLSILTACDQTTRDKHFDSLPSCSEWEKLNTADRIPATQPVTRNPGLVLLDLFPFLHLGEGVKITRRLRGPPSPEPRAARPPSPRPLPLPPRPPPPRPLAFFVFCAAIKKQMTQ